jgi:hypothetical protein
LFTVSSCSFDLLLLSYISTFVERKHLVISVCCRDTVWQEIQRALKTEDFSA